MNCAITPDQIKTIYQVIFNRITTAKNSKLPFDPKVFMLELYNHRITKGFDEADAATFAQQVPALFDKMLTANTDLKRYMVENDFNLQDLAKDVFAIEDAVKADTAIPFIKSYLKIAEHKTKDVEDANKNAKEDATLTPVREEPKVETVVPIPSSTDFTSAKDDFKAAPPSMLADRDQEAISSKRFFPDGNLNPNYNVINPKMVFYYKIKRRILDLLYNAAEGDSTKIDYPGIGPVYLRIQSSSTIDENDLRDDIDTDKYGNPIPQTEERRKAIKEAHQKGVVAVITDADGIHLKFNENGEYKWNGKLAYYWIRRVDTDYQGNVLIRDADKESIQSLSNQTGITSAEATAKIKEELAFIKKIRDYIEKNPSSNHVMSIINGGSRGYAQFDYDLDTPISAINFAGEAFTPKVATETDRTTGEEEGKTYFRLPKQMGDRSIEIERPTIDAIPGLVEKLVSLLTNWKNLVKTDEFGKNPEPVSYLDVKHYINTYFETRKSGLQIYDDNIKIHGEKIDVNTPEGVKKLTDFFKELGPQREIAYGKLTSRQKAGIIKTSDINYQSLYAVNRVLKDETTGKYYIIEKAKLNFSKEAVNDVGKTYMDITLEFIGDGKFKVVEVKKDTVDFIKRHGTIHYALNPENKLLRLNPYFTYTPLDSQIKKIYGQKEPTEISSVPTDTTTSNGPADNKSLLDDILDDPELHKLLDQKGLNKEEAKAKIEAAKVWYENHPLSKHFPFHVLFNAINTKNPRAVATWTVQGITLYKGSDFTDLYHEAWHGFTQTFLSESQRIDLYKETSNLKGSFKDYKGRYVQFSKAKDKQLEEYLAEDFRAYMLSGNTAKSSPVKNTIFQKILNFLKFLFGNSSMKEIVLNDKANRTIKDLYEKMRVGNLTEYNFSAENTSFNQLNKGILSIKDNTDALSYENSMEIVDSVDSLISELVDMSNRNLKSPQALELAGIKNKQTRGIKLTDAEANRLKTLESVQTYAYTSTLIKTKKGIQYCYKHVKDRFIQIRDEIKTQVDATENKEAKAILQKKVDTLSKAIDEFGNDVDLSKNKKGVGVIGYHILKSKFFPTEDKEALIEEMDRTHKEETADRTGYDKSGNETSLKDLASKEILYLLRSLHKKTKDDKTIDNNLNVPELIPFDRVWNRLARMLQDTLTIQEMYRKIDADSRNYPAFKQLLLKLGPVNTSNKHSYDLWTSFWQTFNKTRVPLVQMTVSATTKDEKGDPLAESSYDITVGDASGSHLKVGRRWEDYFKTTRKSEYIKPDAKGTNVLDIAKVIKDFTYSPTDPHVIADKELEFFNAIGVRLDDIPEIREQLKKGIGKPYYILQKLKYLLHTRNARVTSVNDIFRDYPAEGTKGKDGYIFGREGDKSNLSALQELQGKYSDESSNFMVTNAEGNTQFEHSLNNTLTIIINSINAVKDKPGESAYQELIKQSHMSYLDYSRNPMVKASTWLNSVFHLRDINGKMLPETHPDFGKKRREREGGPFIKINLVNLSGVALKEDGDFTESGVASSSADEFTKLILDIHLTLEGKPELMRHADKGTSFSVWLSNVFTGSKTKRMYVDTTAFLSEFKGHEQAVNIIIPHISAELERVNIMKGLAKTGTTNYDFDYIKQGQEFVTFDRALSQATKDKLYALDVPLMDYLESYPELKEIITNDLREYFNSQLEEVNKLMVGVNNFVATSAIKNIKKEAENRIANVNDAMAKDAAVKSFVYNSWIHNLESLTVLYGDLALYKVYKEEFHKRNAGIGSTGNIYRNDITAHNYINAHVERAFTKKHGGKNVAWNGIMNTAVVADNKISSGYLKEYTKAIGDDIRTRLTKEGVSEEKIKKTINLAVEPYTGMDEGDAQGWITMDAYRILLKLEGKWTDDHEKLYQKILKGEKPEHYEVKKFFSTQKLQYYGPLDNEGLPIIGFHKFSLFPLIPTVIEGTRLEALHEKMMNEGIDYALFKTGSKIGTITKDGKTDQLYSDTKSRTISNVPFTPNRIYIEYLKNQLEIAPEFKNAVIFSTQLRKLIEDGLVENGKFINANAERLVRLYEANLNKLTGLKKEEILKDANWTIGKDGKPEGKLDDLMKFVKNELRRQDLADHEIDFIAVNPQTGKLVDDLSLSLSADKIERLLNALVIKRLVRQKVNGEALIQVSGAVFENNEAYTNPSDKDLSKWGTNDLPTYHKKADGTTAAMKVKVALQGSFTKLLEVKHNDGEQIGNRERLNEMLKSEEWLNKDDNRRMITLVATRIPVQGLNSMEFMEVYEFLPTEAGNIIVSPAEIVAKSGSDYDIDKLTVMMPNYQKRNGIIGISRGYTKEEAKVFYEDYKKRKIEQDKTDLVSYAMDMDWDVEEILKQAGALKSFDEFYNVLNNTKAVENDLIWNIKEILALPENFVKLIRPNGTDIVKEVADDLADDVMEYKPKARVFNDGTAAKTVSGTRVLEIQYNLYKHASNNIGKQTLGLGAVDNTYNSLFNRIGFHMNPTAGITTAEFKRLSAINLNKLSYKQAQEVTSKLATYKRQTLLFPNNIMYVNGEKAISLSHILSADGKNIISDMISQLINGWVDIAKDAWIFNVQGNKEIAPSLLFMIQAGVSFETAVYLVSQPLVREYIREQKLAKSVFSGVLGKAPKDPMYFRSSALEEIMANPKFGFNIARTQLTGWALSGTAYKEAVRLTTKELGVDGQFDAQRLKDNITSTEVDDYQRAAFLHFIEIENMGKAVRDVKMRINFDTSKSATLYEAQNKISMIESLKEDNRIPTNMITNLLESSPISSFYVQPFQLEIWKDLFVLRNHQVINRFISDKLNGKDTREDVKKTYGDNERFVNEFRNQLMNYIFQNTMNEFDLDKITAYQGTEVSHSLPVQPVKLLSHGVFLHNNKMYVDKVTLKKQYDNQEYYKEDLMNKIGVATVPLMAFNTPNEYYRFTFERENLRSLYGFEEALKRKDFGDYSKLFADTILQKANEDRASYDNRKVGVLYEMWLRDKALDNTYNGWKLFKSKDTYADQFFRIFDEFSEELKEYSLMKSLALSTATKKSDSTPTFTNLKLRDTLLDGDKINVLHENLIKLADPTVIKVRDNESNERISEFFKRFSLVAFMQSGLNTKSAFSLVRLVPQDMFLRIMKESVEEYAEKVNPTILQDFYNKFVALNNFRDGKQGRVRFMNYASELTLEESIKTKAANNVTAPSLGQEGPNQVFTHTGLGGADGAKNLMESNPNIYFVYNGATDQFGNATKDDFVFYGIGFNNKVGLPTRKAFTGGLNKERWHDAIVDGQQVVDPKFKEHVDAVIKGMLELKNAGYELAFNKEGYAQELIKSVDGKYPGSKNFLYLSEQLYSNFDYANSGYLKTATGKKSAGKKQEAAGQVNDDMVREFMKHCFI